MDPDHVPQHASWGGPAEWGWANWLASDENLATPTDVNYTNPKGKGKGDWNTKGVEGFNTQSSSPIMLAMKSMMMAMKAMKGGGKGPHTPGGPDSGNGGQEGGKAEEGYRADATTVARKDTSHETVLIRR